MGKIAEKAGDFGAGDLGKDYPMTTPQFGILVVRGNNEEFSELGILFDGGTAITLINEREEEAENFGVVEWLSKVKT